MQAISGAGYPGVASMDINANVIPFIGNEEEKMQQETQKILGEFTPDGFRPLAAKVSAHCNRVPVVDGHTVTVSVEFSSKPSEADILEAFSTFRSVPQERQLPSAPPQPVIYMEDKDRPQPRRDVEREKRDGGFCRTTTCLPGVRLQVHRHGSQHDSRRGGRGCAECGADVLGRTAGLMIVMKFGGTSVESAAAIERVRKIVESRLDRRPVVVVSAMGKTTNKLLEIANLAVHGKRDEAICKTVGLARLSFARIRHGADRR